MKISFKKTLIGWFGEWSCLIISIAGIIPVKEKENKIDIESQALAYSLDNGKTWTKYKNNPVIQNPGVKDFRDPKVIRDEVHQQWIMSVAVHDKPEFYASQNLKDWNLLS